MALEAGLPLIESISSMTAWLTLLVGAVRAIPVSGFRLEVLDIEGKKSRSKAKTKKTSAGHALIPHHQSTSLALFASEGGLQTVVSVFDESTNNRTTAKALVIGLRGQVLATLSSLNKKVTLPSVGMIFKYMPPKRAL